MSPSRCGPVQRHALATSPVERCRWCGASCRPPGAPCRSPATPAGFWTADRRGPQGDGRPLSEGSWPLDPNSACWPHQRQFLNAFVGRKPFASSGRRRPGAPRRRPGAPRRCRRRQGGPPGGLAGSSRRRRSTMPSDRRRARAGAEQRPSRRPRSSNGRSRRRGESARPVWRPRGRSTASASSEANVPRSSWTRSASWTTSGAGSSSARRRSRWTTSSAGPVDAGGAHPASAPPDARSPAKLEPVGRELGATVRRS